MIHSTHRGFTLLVAVVLGSVALSIGLALLDIAYKQSVLASSAKQSQFAFYAADAVLECALYYDQHGASFAYSASSASVTCTNQANVAVDFNLNQTVTVGGTVYRTRTFTLPCTGGGTLGYAKVYKAADNTTQIYANGYNLCDTSNERRIERGLRISY